MKKSRICPICKCVLNEDVLVPHLVKMHGMLAKTARMVLSRKIFKNGPGTVIGLQDTSSPRIINMDEKPCSVRAISGGAWGLGKKR